MGNRSKITRRRAIVAGGGTLAFGSGISYFASRSESSSQEYVPSNFHTGDSTSNPGVEIAGRPVIGERDATIDIYYWTDYLCPFCKKFETETLPDIGTNYIETGDARLAILSYPNIGQYSVPSAVWGRCVWDQVADTEPVAHWNWHHKVFDTQAESGTGWADEDTFTTITKQTDGVDASAVDKCRRARSDSIREELAVDIDTAQSAGIQGTPGFILYNRESGKAGKLVGAQPFENFADALDQLLQV